MTNLYLYIWRSPLVHFKWHCRSVTPESSDNGGIIWKLFTHCGVFVNPCNFSSYVIILYNNLGCIIDRELIIRLKSSTVSKSLFLYWPLNSKLDLFYISSFSAKAAFISSFCWIWLTLNIFQYFLWIQELKREERILQTPLLFFKRKRNWIFREWWKNFEVVSG